MTDAKGIGTVATPYVIEHGDVWSVGLSGGERPARHVCRGSGRMGVAFSLEDDVVYRHGEVAGVRAWAERQRAGGMELDVLDFPPVPEAVALLNACVHGYGSAQALIERLSRLDADDPSLAQLPTYPG